MKKIRILVDAHVIGGEGQGTATYIKGLYNAFTQEFSNRYEVFFAGHDLDALVEAFPSLNKSQFIELPRAGRIALFTKIFPGIIKNYKIHFAHFQYNVPFVKNCKFIVTTHDVLFNDFPEEFSMWYRLSRNFLFKRSLLKSDIRLTVSNYSRKAIAHHYGIPKSSIQITPNAVNNQFVAAYDKSDSIGYIKEKYKIDNYILFVSRIEPRKNHELLLNAWKEGSLSKQNIPLLFIGNESLSSEPLTKAINELEGTNKNNFHWIKYVSDGDLIHFLRAARLFVYPSKAEGFGIPPLEAAAAQINTLCANTTAMSDFDFFEDNLFDPLNMEAFKKLLTQNIDHPPAAEKLKLIAERISQKYSWQYSAGVIDDEIRKCEGIVENVAMKENVAID